MQFIKSLWNKVKSFFGRLFGTKKAIANKPATSVVETVEFKEVAVEPTAKAVDVAQQNKLTEIFNRIAEKASFRNYKLDEAYAALQHGDEVTLVRIERAMGQKKYKFKAYRAA